MKKLKKFFGVFVVALIVANFLSCTNENEITNQEMTENQKTENILKIFYDSEFSFGEVIELKNENLIIKEIIINNNQKRRGYITINKLDNTLMYLADIDAEKAEVVGVDYFNNEKIVLSNFQINENGKSILNTDIKNDIKEYSSSTTEKKFWGWTCGPTYPIGEGTCNRNCCYRVMGIVTNCDVYTCSNLPGNNPTIEP